MNTLRIHRIAARIEHLQKTDNRDWDPADREAFLNGLPYGKDSRGIPDGRTLRGMIQAGAIPDAALLHGWELQLAHLEVFPCRNTSLMIRLRKSIRGE